MKKEITIEITNDDRIAHHLPDYESQPKLTNGMTLRAALKVLRGVDWGNIGGTYNIQLSDGSWLSVELEETSDKTGELMSSQRIVRRDQDRGAEFIVRVYKI